MQHTESSPGLKHKATQFRLRVRCACLGGNHNRKCHAQKDIHDVQNCDLFLTRLLAKKTKSICGTGCFKESLRLLACLLLARTQTSHQGSKGKCVSSCSSRSVKVGSTGCLRPGGRRATQSGASGSHSTSCKSAFSKQVAPTKGELIKVAPALRHTSACQTGTPSVSGLTTKVMRPLPSCSSKCGSSGTKSVVHFS